VAIANPLDGVWYELWHHERRADRHGASMMNPDYTYWHGTDEVAKHFYSKVVPDIEHLIRQGRSSGDPAKTHENHKPHRDAMGRTLRFRLPDGNCNRR
jgi:hypothetical protein